jgi:hypothetical protein
VALRGGGYLDALGRSSDALDWDGSPVARIDLGPVKAAATRLLTRLR